MLERGSADAVPDSQMESAQKLLSSLLAPRFGLVVEATLLGEDFEARGALAPGDRGEHVQGLTRRRDDRQQGLPAAADRPRGRARLGCSDTRPGGSFPLRIVEMAHLAPQQRHDLLTRLVAPHSTAMISTLDAVGEPLVAPLGYCVPMRGRLATVAITIAAARDAGGEPELVQAAALTRGELVANLTASDLPQHLADVARVPRERATGAVRWPTTASHEVAVPSLVAGRARLECRVIEPAGQPAVRDRGVARPPTGYLVIAEVVCVVADDDLLAPPVVTPERAAGRVEFPWFFGPGDRSVVDGARAHPVIEQPTDRIDTHSRVDRAADDAPARTLAAPAQPIPSSRVPRRRRSQR